MPQVDRFEINEALQWCLAAMQALKIPHEKLNVEAARVHGHPIGASGARIVVTLLHTLIRIISLVA